MRSGKVAVVAILAISVGATWSVPVATAGTPTAAEIKKLKQKAIAKVADAAEAEGTADETGALARAGSDPKIKIVSCKQTKRRGKFAGFDCAWSAQGEEPGIVPFKCSGHGSVDKKAKRVKSLDPCENRLELQAPLLATPHD